MILQTLNIFMKFYFIMTTNIQLAKDQLQAIFDNLPVGEQFPFKDFQIMNTLKDQKYNTNIPYVISTIHIHRKKQQKCLTNIEADISSVAD